MLHNITTEKHLLTNKIKLVAKMDTCNVYYYIKFLFFIFNYFYLEALLSFSFMKKLTVRMNFDSLKFGRGIFLSCQ